MTLSFGRIGVFAPLWAVGLLSIAPAHALAAKKAAQSAPVAEAPSPEALARADNLAILNAIRPETERRLDQGPVAFKIRTLRIVEDYALLEANLEHPDGRALGNVEGPPQIASAILRKLDNRWMLETLRLGAATPWSTDFCARVPAGLLNDCPATVALR